MLDWEKDKCLLCGKEAEKHVYKDPLGDKYICSECPLYAVPGFWNVWIKYFAIEEEKKALASYLKSHPDSKGEFKEIDTEFIIEALKTLPESRLLKKALSKKIKVKREP